MTENRWTAERVVPALDATNIARSEIPAGSLNDILSSSSSLSSSSLLTASSSSSSSRSSSSSSSSSSPPSYQNIFPGTLPVNSCLSAAYSPHILKSVPFTTHYQFYNNFCFGYKYRSQWFKLSHACLSVCLSVCLPACLSLCLSVRAFVRNKLAPTERIFENLSRKFKFD